MGHNYSQDINELDFIMCFCIVNENERNPTSYQHAHLSFSFHGKWKIQLEFIHLVLHLVTVYTE